MGVVLLVYIGVVGLSKAGRLAHQEASIAPDMFIQGPKMADGSAAIELCQTLMASPEAIPPFCRPTSMATVREFVSPRPSARAP